MTEVVTVALDQIRLNTYNPNSMDAGIFESLLQGMKEGGPESIDPILLRPLKEDTYEIVDGEHRTKAARELGWSHIGARIQEMSLPEAMVINFRKNRERGRLDPVKEGRLYKWWRDEQGLSSRAIGKKFDIDHAHVLRRIRNVETVNDEAIAALTGVKPSKETAGDTCHHLRKTESSPPVKEYVRPAVREEPIAARKLDLLGSINFARFLKRARPLRGLSEAVPEDVPIIEEIRTRYEEKTKALQLEVAEEIREKSFRQAETFVEDVWGKLVVEGINERRDRERRAVKIKLESEGKVVILEEEKNWTHRDQIAEQGNVISKCLNECPKPTVMVTRSGKVEAICGFGGCWTQTREDLKAEEARKAEEETRKIREARDILIKAGEAGDVYWLRWLLFLELRQSVAFFA